MSYNINLNKAINNIFADKSVYIHFSALPYKDRTVETTIKGQEKTLTVPISWSHYMCDCIINTLFDKNVLIEFSWHSFKGKDTHGQGASTSIRRSLTLHRQFSMTFPVCFGQKLIRFLWSKNNI